MNSVKMINNTQANMYGVNIDVVEWAEVLIDPKSLIRLRNECRNFSKSNKSDKIAIIKVANVAPRNYDVTIAEIGADETGYAAALRSTFTVRLNQENQVYIVVPTLDKHNSFNLFENEINEAIKKYFKSYSFIPTTEDTL